MYQILWFHAVISAILVATLIAMWLGVRYGRQPEEVAKVGITIIFWMLMISIFFSIWQIIILAYWSG